MATNVTSLPSQQDAVLPSAMVGIVEVDTSSGTTYAGTWQILPGAYARAVANIIGPESTDTTFVMVAAKDDSTVGGIYNSKLHELRDEDNEISPIGPITVGGITVRMASKVRIRAVPKIKAKETDQERTDPDGPIVYVGYVTDMELIYEGKQSAEYRVICQDSRFLESKAPVQGVVHYNHLESVAAGSEQVVFIRDAEIVFNEGGKPNRYHNESDLNKSEQLPRFCQHELNRFVDDSGDLDRDGFYAHDGWIENTTELDANRQPLHARKWYAGHAINYMTMLMDDRNMGTAGQRVYNDPSSDPGVTKRPVTLFGSDGEVWFSPLAKRGLDGEAYADFFEPRSFIGADDPDIAAQEAVTALGEYDPTGTPINQAIDDVIRRVGNYVQVRHYTENKTQLLIARSIQGYQEEKTLPIGILGGEGGADGRKQIKLKAPTTKDNTRPDINSMALKTSIRSYHNRFHMKGGPRWIQVTLSTVGRSTWTDGLGQFHALYDTTPTGGVPDGEWVPRLTTPTLEPAWSTTEQKEWLFYSTANLNFTIFPDVYRAWVVPDDLNWVNVWGLSSTVGWERYFEKDRSWLNRLLTSYFDRTIGLYRTRRTHLDIQVWRAFRGIRLNSDGDTAYGDAENTQLKGKRDWFLVPGSWELFADGRGIGFRLDEDSRSNTLYELEGAADPQVASTVQRTPASWNGAATLADLTALAAAEGLSDKKWEDYTDAEKQQLVDAYDPGTDMRAYEHMITIAVKGDEDLWHYLQLDKSNPTSAMNIGEFGPPMELMRNGMTHYEEERASHSLVDVAFTAARDGQKSTLREVPPVDGADESSDDANEPRVYRNDLKEMQARVNMLANRYGMVDIEAPVVLQYLDFTIQPGAYISELEVSGDNNIRFKAMVAAVHWDFALQKTTIRFATVR